MERHHRQPALLPQRVLSAWPPADGGRGGVLGSFVAAVGELLAAEERSAELLAAEPLERGSVTDPVILGDRKLARQRRRLLEELAAEAGVLEEEALVELHEVVARGGAWDLEIARLPPVVAVMPLMPGTLRSLGQPGALSGRLDLLRDAGFELRAGWQLRGGFALEGLAPLGEAVPAVRAGVARERLRAVARGGPASLIVALPLPDAAALQAAHLEAWRLRAALADAEAAAVRRIEAQSRLRRSTDRGRSLLLAARGLDAEAVAADEEPPLQPASVEGRVRLKEYRSVERLVKAYAQRRRRTCGGAAAPGSPPWAAAAAAAAAGSGGGPPRPLSAACFDCREAGLCWKHHRELLSHA